MHTPTVIRTNVKMEPDSARVLIRSFVPSPSRVVKIIARILAQPDDEIQEHLDKIRADFSNRHIEVENTFLEQYEEVKNHHFSDLEPSHERKLLIGSYLTSEFSLESAALFNPSMVLHPDQSNLNEGSKRFIISLRAVGEGHVSSIEFRSGTIDKDNEISIEPPTRFVETPSPVIDRELSKAMIAQKFWDMGFANAYSGRVFELLSPMFTIDDMHTVIREIHHRDPSFSMGNRATQQSLISLVSSNYDVAFDPTIPLGGRTIFPCSPSEKNGIEDARFVQFKDEEGQSIYYATATAWDGKTMLSQLIETTDFLNFKVRTLNGEAVKNKGMALFPRKVDGNFAMISRQDNENIHLMYSDHLQFWRESEVIMKPAHPWEFYQIGNCGSPIETDEGWLVITHGVGAMRRYAIGAALLDLSDPSRVIGRTEKPFLVPNENEREGYVPNVVYSCGAMIHNNMLVLPYAMSDQASRIALVNLEELLASLSKEGKRNQ